MKKFQHVCLKFLEEGWKSLTSRKGQTLVEYALLLVLIAIVVFLMVKGVGRQTNCVYSTINSVLY